MYRQPPSKKYWGAFGALYGNSSVVIASKPRKKRRNDEEREQIKFNVWFEKFLAKYDYRWFHPANGGRRSVVEGAKLKAMGVKRGVPDVILPVAKKTYHGLVIEIKREDGKQSDVSEEQKDWLEYFKRQNWSTHVAFGFEMARKITEEYLHE